MLTVTANRSTSERYRARLACVVGLLTLAMLCGCGAKMEETTTSTPPVEMPMDTSMMLPDTSMADTTMHDGHTGSDPEDPPPPPMSAPPDEITQFPWPPPEPTLRYSIPRQLIARDSTESSGRVVDRITTALNRAGIDMWSIHAIGSKGFAVIGRMEHIKDNGTPDDPRFSLGAQRNRKFDLGAYLKALIFATPGRYRVIVIAITPEVIRQYGKSPTAAQLETLLHEGASDLPDPMRGHAIGRIRPEALIYEFHRRDAHSEPVLVNSNRTTLSAVDHLAGAGIWSKDQLVGERNP